MRRSGWVLPTLLLIFIVSILWSPDFLWRLSRQSTAEPSDLELLRAENSYLRAELVKKSAIFSLPATPFNTVLANVYSRYPINFKHELIIDKGIRDHVREGSVVVVPIRGEDGGQKLFFVGSVSSTFLTKSSVHTLFDYRFKSAVQMGSGKISGLIVGGLNPTITLIPKDAKLSPGDVVLGTASDFPYGIMLGRVKDIRPSSDKLFKEAGLELPYDVSRLVAVAVEVN
ncbi:MAG: rod shape-determining protein MreC [Patescibacteria group bacterium]